MAQVIESNDIFGKIGRGFGQGLGQQIPKEMEHRRLSEGLQKLSQQTDLDPMQFFTKALSTYGLPPQALEPLGRLAAQKQWANALTSLNPTSNQDISSAVKDINIQPNQSIKTSKPNQGPAPSLSTGEISEQARKGYLPKTPQQTTERAAELFKENPGRFKNNPENAFKFAQEEDINNQERQKSIEGIHEKRQQVVKNIENRLREHTKKLKVQIPADQYSKLEDEAINSVKPISEGGEGLDEQQAMKKYGAKADEISRQYSDLDAIGNWGIVLKPAKMTLDKLKSIQKEFKARDDTRNMAQYLQAEHGLSPTMSYSIAEPISDTPELNREFKNIPDLTNKYASIRHPDVAMKTLEVSEKLAKKLGFTGSPLSVAHELRKRNYDPQIWLDYLQSEKDNLNLTDKQWEQTRKTESLLGNMNDRWLSSFSGIE